MEMYITAGSALKYAQDKHKVRYFQHGHDCNHSHVRTCWCKSLYTDCGVKVSIQTLPGLIVSSVKAWGCFVSPLPFTLLLCVL